ncbi:MAG: glycosyltransferase [Cycloclasticus sp.]|uniref:glycosyltransferase n=1 Tax=Cycloclasticus sp. TaxID=2024830 RepID=UPI00257EA379|nr:glycosyltransferase [Cycloclasticus sp.]MBV1899522.1 glycosyltransferase [Cycloclasticus sp.]
MLAKFRVLVFVHYYLPGYKAGGPLRTIANMADHLAEEVEFLIVTSDRDLGDSGPYVNVNLNTWVSVGEAQVFYCTPERQTIASFTKLINETPHDLLYLNSFFDSVFTVRPLYARTLGRFQKKPTLLAPRGEFSKGALKLKRIKKNIYIWGAKIFGLCNKILWHASSEYEAEDIKRFFSIPDDKVFIALDLPAKVAEVRYEKIKWEKESALKLIFLSRISAKKNLDFALRLLSKVACEVIFHIYGPKEDLGYWANCEALIEALPENVNVKYCGIVIPDDVGQTFAAYDLFLFPTLGENYGHVIAEAISVGTPVLLSDQTPWRNLKPDGLGWDLPLEHEQEFVNIIEECASQSQEQKNKTRAHIQCQARKRLVDADVIKANRQLFHRAVNQ